MCMIIFWNQHHTEQFVHSRVVRKKKKNFFQSELMLRMFYGRFCQMNWDMARVQPMWPVFLSSPLKFLSCLLLLLFFNCHELHLSFFFFLWFVIFVTIKILEISFMPGNLRLFLHHGVILNTRAYFFAEWRRSCACFFVCAAFLRKSEWQRSPKPFVSCWQSMRLNEMVAWLAPTDNYTLCKNALSYTRTRTHT